MREGACFYDNNVHTAQGRKFDGTLIKVRVYTGSGYADMPDEKVSCLICNEMMTGDDPSQMSQLPERSST